MRALGLALMLLALPAAGAGRQQEELTDSGATDAAEIPVDHGEAGGEGGRIRIPGRCADGQHRNDTDNPLYFTTAFFHHPGELSAEVREAGFTLTGLFAVEGPGAFVPEFQRRWKDPRDRERLLELLRRVEREPALLGASPHLLAVGQKPWD